jgi:phosphoglycerate dehydrogenase-like enzyme
MRIVVAIFSDAAWWNLPEAQVDRLRAAFPDLEFVHVRTHDELVRAIGAAEVAFAGEMPPDALAAAPALRWIHSPAAGVGGMLHPALVNGPVVVTNSRGLHAASIAEHVIGVSLALLRRLPLVVSRQTERRWAQAELADAGIRLLQGLRMGIVGAGAIGSAVARLASAFGMEVIASRRRVEAGAPEGVRAVLPPERLHDLLSASDIVVLAAPQTRQTWSLIGRAELDAMKPDSILVNVSRGKLVDERALIDALSSRSIGGAALDVFAREPLDPQSPLWRLPNVLITPHVSGMRPDYWDAAIAIFEDNLRRYRTGEPLQNIVDKTAGY